MRLGLVVALGAALVIRPADAGAETDAERGAALLQTKGCLACHSMDGTAKTGPTFKQIWGRHRPVTTAEGSRDIVVDEAYIARSLREPEAEIAAGYPPRSMPKSDMSDDDIRAIVTVLRSPESVDQSKMLRGGSILPLALAAAAFVLLHFLLSSIPVRRRVVEAAGAKGFSSLYSLWAFLTFGAMIFFYRTAPFVQVWAPPTWTRWVPVLTMPLAVLFLVAGFSTPNPTAVAQDGRAADEPRGIIAVTRHPALWGFAIWAAGHLATNGELHVMIVAGAILVLAIGGMLHIDARRKASLGPAWDGFAAKTSLAPFAAIAQGRARLVPAEIGGGRVAMAALIYILLYFVHPFVIGASPSP